MLRTIVSWLGQTDLDCADAGGSNGLGPLAQALVDREFDRAVILCNYSDERLEGYVAWLRSVVRPSLQVDARPSALEKRFVTDFVKIYEAVAPVLEEIIAAGDAEVTYHLSPGTPAMQVVWVLLNQSRFPGRMLKSSKEQGVEDVVLPFAIAAEFAPVLASQGWTMQQLAAGLPPAAAEFEAIIHRCQVMQDVITLARAAALRDVPVLIEGESGTGKELLARAIHRGSRRWDGPFIAVNCGAIPESLVESHLFGHEKGAFTGADRLREGVFEAAKGGTLFLDEIGELPAQAQVRLLRVLQERKVLRVGSTREIEVDVRLVAATNRSLVDETRQGRFRVDLFYRLAVAVLRVPPLREREGDVSLLVDHLLSQVNREQRNAMPGWQDRVLDPSARAELLRHRWPGNIRELMNTLTRMAIWNPSTVIGADQVRRAIMPAVSASTETILGRPLGATLDVNALVDEVKRHYVERALAESGGVLAQAYQLIGLNNATTLKNWMEKLGIETGR